MKQFDIERYLLFLDIYQITFMNSVPTILVMLSKHPTASNYNLTNVEQVNTGSAPLGKGIGKIISQRFLRPGVQVKQGWGMTETTCSATSFAADDEDDGGSIGWLNANVSAKITPVEGRELENESSHGYKIGEIWISGPNIMKGYYNKPKETAETIIFENGRRWLRTGDIGYVDARGCLYIVDRMKASFIQWSQISMKLSESQHRS
jgi:4-coumarate--CoA ligase